MNKENHEKMQTKNTVCEHNEHCTVKCTALQVTYTRKRPQISFQPQISQMKCGFYKSGFTLLVLEHPLGDVRRRLQRQEFLECNESFSLPLRAEINRKSF